MTRHRTIVALLAVVAVGLLQGCFASGKLFEPVVFDASQESLIYIYRLTTFSFMGHNLDVGVDGHFIGKLSNGGYAYALVPPGGQRHEIGYRISLFGGRELFGLGRRRSVRVEAGGIAYVRIMGKGDIGGPYLEVKQVANEEGEAEIQKMKFQAGLRLVGD